MAVYFKNTTVNYLNISKIIFYVKIYNKKNASCGEQEAKFVLQSKKIQVADHFHNILTDSLGRVFKTSGRRWSC